MKNTTTLQSKRSITVLLGVLLYFSSLSAQTMQDTIIANFSLMERIPKEKLYLHLGQAFLRSRRKDMVQRLSGERHHPSGQRTK